MPLSPIRALTNGLENGIIFKKVRRLWAADLGIEVVWMEAIEVLPIRVRVTAILRKELLSGGYAPGEELSLTEIAAQLGVSRTPVREAFQSLAAEGLLELRMNRGAVVIGIDEKFIRDHFELRTLLESNAAAQAAENGMDVSPLLQIQQDAETNALSEQEYRAYNQRIHTAIWDAAGNRKQYQVLQSLWNGPSAGTRGRDLNHEALSIREHRQILELIAQRKPQAAREIMAAHIARSMENILACFRASRTKEEPKG